MKKRYFFGIMAYLVLSFLTSYATVYKEFVIVRFLLTSLYYLIFFLVIFLIIPDLIRNYKIKKLIKKKPNLFEPKFLEIKESGIELRNVDNSEINCFKWDTVKKIFETSNFNFIVFENKKTLILKKGDAEKKEFVEKIRVKMKKKWSR